MNFAIIGCGVIASTHVQALAQLKDEGCVLYAVCDIIKSKADSFAKQNDVKHVYYDYNELLKDKNIDIVCVCIPSGIHAEACIAASKAKKAIVCEKPMDITPQRISEVIKEIQQSNVKMQCVFQRRLMPVAQEIKKIIAQGKLGKIAMACADLRYYRDQEYYNSADWRATWALDGGGALMNQGVHGIDLIVWMLGDKVSKVFGKIATLTHDIEVEDNALAIIQMESGTLCSVQSSTSAYPGYSTTFSIHGELGSVSFNDEQILEWNFIDKQNTPQRPDIGEKVGGDKSAIQIGNKGHVLLLKDIANAVKNDSETIIPISESLTAVKIICDIYESSKTGVPIKW